MMEQQRSPRPGPPNPGFWTSSSHRKTYASYPAAWEENYLSTMDDFKAFSFGRPPNSNDGTEQGSVDARWNIVNREGDETSSSSEEEGQRRSRSIRDITPRASVVSLDALASQQTTPAQPRSHPSQINYYHRGTSNIAEEEHQHPFELDLALSETRSEYSIDPGYDAGSSYRSGSYPPSYEPSLDISISSGKASSAEVISISSSRRSSDERRSLVYEVPSFVNSLESDSALSISSLRFDAGPDSQEDIIISDPIPTSVSPPDRPNPPSPGPTAEPTSNAESADWRLLLGSYPSSTSNGIPSSPLAKPQTKPRSRLRSVSTSASSASTTPSQHPFDADKDFDISYIVSGLALNLNNNAKADDDTYASELDFVRRVSGTGTRIGSSSRGTGRGTGSGYGARDGPSGLNSTNPGTKIGSGKSLGWGDDPAVRIPSITPRRARARAATTTSASPSVYSMRKPMTISTSTGPVLERDTTGTATTKAASMVAPVAVTTITSERGTADDGGDATMLQSNSGASIPSPSAPSSSNLPPKPDSPSSLSSSTSLPFSPAPILNAEQLDITSLIEDNSINSMNGIPRTQMDTVKRKKSGVLSGLGIGGLGVLGVGSSKAARSSASLSSSASARTSSPSPGSPSRMGGASVSVSFGTEDDGHESSSSLSLSSSSLSSLSLPAAVAPGAVPISTTGLASTEESEKVGLSTPSSDASPSSKAPQPLTISTHLVPTPKPNTDMNASSSGETPISTVMTAPVSSLVPTSITTSRTYPRPSSITSLQSSNSTPFTHDDSFARVLMAWGGPEYGDKRKEWVIRRERMKGEGNGKGRANGVREGTENRKDKESGKHTDNIDKPWEGLPPGTEEVWGNFLLGRFNVSREDVYPRNQRSGLAESGGAESTNADPHQASEGQGASGDVNAKALGKSKRGGSTREAEILGFRVPVGKPPQHRLIIKRLRDDQDRLTQPSSGNRWRGQSGPSSGGRRTITTAVENTAMEVDAYGKRNYSLLDSNTASSSTPQIKRPIAAQESSPQSRNPRVVPTSGESIASNPRRQFDPQHPTILIHKHSKVAAFSLSRQYRDRDKDRSVPKDMVPEPPSSTAIGPSVSFPLASSGSAATAASSSGRLHVVMLAQREVQESFTTTETTKKLGTVIDRHEAVRAAFSPGAIGRSREKEKGKGKKRSSLAPSSLKGKNIGGGEHQSQIKSDGHIELARADAEDTPSRFGLRYVKSKPGELRDSVGTKSAPVYKLPHEAQIEESNERESEEEKQEEKVVIAIDNGSSGDGRRNRTWSQSRANYQRAYGTLDQPPSEIFTRTGTGTRPRLPSTSSRNEDSSVVHARSSSILKRFLPWGDTSSSAISSKGSSTVGTNSSTQSASSVSTRDTTTTLSVNSDFTVPYIPPWVTFASRDQQDVQRKVLGQLEHSFENFGLIPSKEKKNSKKSGALHNGGLTSRLNKKIDVLSCVPVDAFFMLLPLWPAETDVHSQRLVPFQLPSIPLDSRRYLLVFYKTLQAETDKASSSSSPTDPQNILLPGFRAIARQVSYSDLQGTGVRAPEQGLSVSGPLEDAFKQMPRPTSATTPLSSPSCDDIHAAQLSIIGSCYSREAGVEFDPEALIELDLCTVLGGEKKPLPPGMVAEQFDSEQSMTVKLTPIGSAVMELVWVGGLALTSFGSQT